MLPLSCKSLPIKESFFFCDPRNPLFFSALHLPTKIKIACKLQWKTGLLQSCTFTSTWWRIRFTAFLKTKREKWWYIAVRVCPVQQLCVLPISWNTIPCHYKKPTILSEKGGRVFNRVIVACDLYCFLVITTLILKYLCTHLKTLPNYVGQL